MANKELAPLLIEGNFIARINQQAKTINALSRTATQTSFVSDITNDLGDMRAGRFIALSIGDEPTDSNACGVVIDAAGETFGDVVYNLYGLNYGSLTFGLRADDGVAVFLNGNAIISTDGIDVTDTLKWIVRQTATNSTYTRTAKVGMALPEGGGTIPCLEMSLASPAGTELVTNGGAETGDFTGWTKTTETNGAWDVTTLFYKDGSHSFRFIASGAGSNGVMTSARIAITAGVNYNISSSVKPLNGPIDTFKVEVKWYDNATAGSLLSTDLVNSLNSYSGWNDNELIVTAPIGALSAEIVVTISDASTQGAGCFDSISMSAVTVNTKLQLRDDGVYADGALIGGGGSYNRQVLYTWKEAITTVPIDTFANLTGTWFNGLWRNTTANAADGDTYYFYPLLDSGTYEIFIVYTKYSYSGKLDTYVNSTAVDTGFDLYASSQSNGNEKTISSITISSSGQQEIKFVVNGKNASSSDYVIAINAIVIRRTGD